MTMPQQRPGDSKQDYQTPPELIRAVKLKLGVTEFYRDLAADQFNTQAKVFYTKEDDSLTQSWETPMGQWNWLNPEYEDIEQWVLRGLLQRGVANTAILIPSSTGANYWRDFIHHKSRVLFLNGRVTFVGHTMPYPKDLALILYGGGLKHGYEVWDWRKE